MQDSTQLHCYNLVKSLKIRDQTPQEKLSELWSLLQLWGTASVSSAQLAITGGVGAVTVSPLIAVWRQAVFHSLARSWPALPDILAPVCQQKNLALGATCAITYVDFLAEGY